MLVGLLVMVMTFQGETEICRWSRNLQNQSEEKVRHKSRSLKYSKVTRQQDSLPQK